MALFLAALQGVPTALYEAASMDGAKGWAKIRYITIPSDTADYLFLFLLQILSIRLMF